MSKRTIRIIDLSCSLTNWRRSIEGTPDASEKKAWTKRRDKKMVQINSAIAKLTSDEVRLMRTYPRHEQFVADLQEEGVKLGALAL